jgi:bacillithiol system protein YtxJ
MNINNLQEIQQLADIKAESEQTPVLIFKHSTRCSISSMAWDRLKRNWREEDDLKVKLFYLDLIAFRNISNAIEQEFQVRHESPQVLLIHKGKVVYHESHMGIQHKEIIETVNSKIN